MSIQLKLPESLMFPVEITRLFGVKGQEVKRRQPLLQYKYWNRAEDGIDEDGNEIYETREFYANFESPYDGTITDISVIIGDRINGADTNILRIEEACDHSVQYGGLCAKCGKTLDEKDYMGYSQTDRAPIAMSHGTQGLTVSRNEAEQLENASTKRLLEARKLILIVDLDQTIIHAAVDPVIGQWINDTSSPNHDAVKDVKSFMLKEQRRDGPVNCWYYVKLRPGLAEFLQAVSQMYELHIYTMATKAYALEIAKLVDPDGRYFGDRILGREESGSMIQKSLKRLFPVTTELVTVIDDRGDVWGWSSHLVRVVPYNFFEGTGDINSGLLPKRAGLVTPGSEPEDQAETPVEKHRLLHDHDTELPSLGDILSRIHLDFFNDYDKKKKADIGQLLPTLKAPVFSGCVFLFSGIFPLGVSIENADIVQWVRSFGALVVAQFVPAVTHVIANNGGTVKTRMAAGAGVPVVGTNWLFACLKGWKRVPTMDFQIKVADPIKPEEAAASEASVESEEGSFGRQFNGVEVDWDEMNKELEEFMTSEEEDVAGEGSQDSDELTTNDADNSDSSKGSNGTASLPTQSKRSRPEDSDDEEQVVKKLNEGAQADGDAPGEESDSDADLAAELALEFQ